MATAQQASARFDCKPAVAGAEQAMQLAAAPGGGAAGARAREAYIGSSHARIRNGDVDAAMRASARLPCSARAIR